MLSSKEIKFSVLHTTQFVTSVCLYKCIALSSLPLLASIFLLFILINKIRDSMRKNEGDQESRAGQEPVRPLCLAT